VGATTWTGGWTSGAIPPPSSIVRIRNELPTILWWNRGDEVDTGRQQRLRVTDLMKSSRAGGRPLASAQAVVAGLWLFSAAGGLVIVINAVMGIDPAARDAWTAVIVFALVAIDALTCTTVGALIVMRRPDNVVGWLLAAIGVGLVLTFAGFGLAGTRTAQAGPDDSLAGLALWTGVIAFNPTLAIVGLVMMVFPDGHLPSPRWRAPIGAVIVMMIAATSVIAIKPGDFDPTLPPNPFGFDHPVVQMIAPVALAAASVVGLVSILLGAVAVGWRFARARGDTREQIKWFLGAVSLVALTIVPGIVVTSTPFTATSEGGSQEFGIFDVVGAASLALLPMAIGVAILRYRLYDIDRLISRTVGWVLTTVVLLAVFATGIVAIQAVLARVIQGQTLAVAASTLATFALFQPVRRRVQGAVDRRFDRAHYDAARVIEGFSASLRDELELGTISHEIMRVATDAVRPASAAVWLRPGFRVQPREGSQNAPP
jgi:hypothetical protein